MSLPPRKFTSIMFGLQIKMYNIGGVLQWRKICTKCYESGR